MNFKVLRILILSIFLIFLPLGLKVKAADAENLKDHEISVEENKNSNTHLEEVIEKEKSDLSEEKSGLESKGNLKEEDFKKVEEKTQDQASKLEKTKSTEEALDGEAKKEVSENPIEEKAVLISEETKESEDDLEATKLEKDFEEVSEEVGEQVADLAEEERLEEPEIGDAIVPYFGGGGSSGGGGGSGPDTSWFDGRRQIEIRTPGSIFRIEKLNEDGKTMEVSFRITNLTTKESYIVKTDKNGMSNMIDLDGSVDNGRFFLGDIIAGGYVEKEEAAALESDPNRPEFRKENIPDPEYPEGMQPGGSIGGGSGGVEVGGSEGNRPLDYDGPKLPDVTSFFKKDGYKINFSIIINYGKAKISKQDNTLSITDPKIFEEDKKSQLLNYDRDRLIDPTSFRGQYSGLIHKFAKNRLITLYKEGKEKNFKLEDGEVLYYDFVISYDLAENPIYKIEELRDNNNLNYSLKTLYLKKGNNGELLFGENQENIDKTLDISKETGADPSIYLKRNIEELLKEFRDNKLPNYYHYTYPWIYDPGFVPASLYTDNSILLRNTGEGSGVGNGGSGSGSSGHEFINKDVPLMILKIVNEKFKFETLASHPDNEDQKTVEKGTNTVVKDKISFDKLKIGAKYEFKGKLIHKASGKEVETLNPISYTIDKLSQEDLAKSLDLIISFDSTAYKAGDEFVLIYEIYEDGKLAGYEKDLANLAQTFKIIEGQTPPPPGDTPPPPKEVPPPPKEVPPPEEEIPPIEKEEAPKEREVEERPVVETVKTVKVVDKARSPQTFDPGIAGYLSIAGSSILGLAWLERKKK